MIIPPSSLSESVGSFLLSFLYWLSNPEGNYMFKVNNRNTKTRLEICSKSTIKTPKCFSTGKQLRMWSVSFVLFSGGVNITQNGYWVIKCMYCYDLPKYQNQFDV